MTMPKPASSSPALPIAHVVLRILIVLNWVMVPVILALLFVIPNREWIMSALKLDPSPEAERWLWACARSPARPRRSAAELWRPQTSARDREDRSRGRPIRRHERAASADDRLDPACAAALSIVIGTIGKSISTPEHPVRLDAGFSTNGWLAVLLTFLLASVFAAGTRMRDDLEGTV
jgi:hypothetical protein